MEISVASLAQCEWVEPSGSGVRLKFRKDGTGYYEREGGPGARLVQDNLLFKTEEDTLHLKFAHARSWTAVAAELQEGSAPEGSRIGHWKLTLQHDPYVKVFDEKQSGALELVSDTGAALLG
jgi:hypothetical protein